MSILWNILKHWLPLAVVTAGLAGLVYLIAQQSLRLNANDPQIQLAQDAAQALSSGSTPADLLPGTSIEISQSLAPFLVIYDESGLPKAGSGLLHGVLPALPSGVFDYTAQHGEDRFTWQPEAGVRIAAVVERIDRIQPGFVLAGRSLLESEARTDTIGLLTGLALLVTWIASFLTVVFCELVFPRSSA